MKNYYAGDVVSLHHRYYICMNDHGYDFNNVRIPGFTAWEQIEAYEWDSLPYNQWDVVKYKDQFFTLADMKDFNQMVNPLASDNWGLIGTYDPEYNEYELSDHEYVVYEDKVYYPTINPNYNEPQVGVNIRANDPRNFNLKKHMTQLALYELHKLISPVNISSVRIDDYNHSMLWLKDASKLKLNPQIPRKLDRKDNMPVTDWQMATFQADFDPNQNPWLT